MKTDIVIIKDARLIPENGWQCMNNEEAVRMVNWLKTQGVEARTVKLSEFKDTE